MRAKQAKSREAKKRGEMMRKQFIPKSDKLEDAHTAQQASDMCDFDPIKVVEVEGGYMCFETKEDCESWSGQYL